MTMFAEDKKKLEDKLVQIVRLITEYKDLRRSLLLPASIEHMAVMLTLETARAVAQHALVNGKGVA